MRIAICDDDRMFLDAYHCQLEKILQARRIKATIELFTNPVELLEAAEQLEVFYDMVLLDIEMPEMNGKECARRLRLINKHFKLIFITFHADQVFTSFGLNPSAFIPKDHFKQLIPIEIDRIITEIEAEQEHWLAFDVVSDEDHEKKLVRVKPEDILFFESIQRKVALHTKEDTFLLSSIGFEAIKAEYRKLGFIEVHRLTFVNVRAISSLGKQTLQLVNGHELQVSRRRYQAVLQAMQEYMANLVHMEYLN